MRAPRAAEFFAGIGLMRLGLEAAGIETVWANDIEPAKRDMYVANFGDGEFALGDVRDVSGSELPDVELATASFPCTDLSLAGARRGLGDAGAPRGIEGGSSMFWEFARALEEMDERRPGAILLENVLGFASSHGGRDLAEAVGELNRLGYSCDLMAIDARHFVPQSRPRMFIVGVASAEALDDPEALATRPRWVRQFHADHPRAQLHTHRLPAFPTDAQTLADVVERLPSEAPEWWEEERVERFASSLSPLQAERVARLRASGELTWRTAYRRTRGGGPTWEVRQDEIAGCLRTARGGSSKQALVELGHGELRVRWMTPREYARLMGAPDFALDVRRNQALFGFGDAVCVPVISWLCEHYVAPAAQRLAPLPLAC
jgi:DNA (cytosine-5)-methyltransferase 1